MLRSPSPSRRVTGRLLIAAAAAAVLPLTAGHAIAYVDVPASAPARVPAPAMAPPGLVASAAAIQAVPASAPVPAVRPMPRPASHAVYAHSDRDGDMTINERFVTIDGVRKRWEDLAPAEFARIRAAVAKARTQLANTHIDQARLERDLANVPDTARIEEMRRRLAETRTRVAEHISRIDAEAARARASGREPDRLEAAVRERLAEAESTDFEAAERSLANIDRKKIADQVAGAQQSVERAKAQLERIQARIDADPRH